MNPATTSGTVIEVRYKFRDRATVKIKGTAKQVARAIFEFENEVNNYKQK